METHTYRSVFYSDNTSSVYNHRFREVSNTTHLCRIDDQSFFEYQRNTSREFTRSMSPTPSSNTHLKRRVCIHLNVWNRYVSIEKEKEIYMKSHKVDTGRWAADLKMQNMRKTDREVYIKGALPWLMSSWFLSQTMVVIRLYQCRDHIHNFWVSPCSHWPAKPVY